MCFIQSPFNDEGVARERACVNATARRAVSDINAPELMRYYESRHPKTPVLAMAKGEAAK